MKMRTVRHFEVLGIQILTTDMVYMVNMPHRFWRQHSLMNDLPFPIKFALQVANPPFEQDKCLLIAPQPWELAE